jgi:hypothetical protein
METPNGVGTLVTTSPSNNPPLWEGTVETGAGAGTRGATGLNGLLVEPGAIELCGALSEPLRLNKVPAAIPSISRKVT